MLLRDWSIACNLIEKGNLCRNLHIEVETLLVANASKSDTALLAVN